MEFTHDIILEYESLLQLLYLSPMGIAQLDTRGEILMLNPRCVELLLPLAGREGIDNIFAVLNPILPDLQSQCEAFPHERGTVLSRQRIRLFPWDAEEVLVTCIKVSEERFALIFWDPRDAFDTPIAVWREDPLSAEAFHEHLESTFKRSRRNNTPLTLVRAELQAAEDVDPEAIALAFQANIRASDSITFWDQSQVAILLPRTPIQAAITVVERLFHNTAAAHPDAHITFGLALAREHYGDCELFVNVAEEALERARVQSSGTIVLDEEPDAS